MPNIHIKLNIDGDSYEFDIDPLWTLLDALREERKICGASMECARGDCGVCIVLLDGEPVVSCQVRAVDASGCEIVTSRGLVRVGQFISLRANYGLL